MKLKQFITDFLTFSRKDRTGALVLLAIIFSFTFVPRFIGRISGSKSPVPDSTLSTAVKILNTRADSFRIAHKKYSTKEYKTTPEPKGRLFYFDPNVIDEKAWKELGVRERTIRTIQKFLAKGGRFKKPSDLEKIYGLSEVEAARLIPFVHITPTVENYVRYEKKLTPRIPSVEINTADTSGFISLPGIGSKLATRIVLFREKLGGFHSIDQIREVYGLQDSVFQKIKSYLEIRSTIFRKVNINTATIEELKSHPYFRWSLANPVIAYRNEHGLFKDIEDLKNIFAITQEVFEKIKHYVTTE